MSRKQWLILKLMLLIFIFIIIFGISIGLMSYSKFGDQRFKTNMTSSMPLEEGEKKSFSNVEKVIVNSISLPVHIYESDVTEVTLQDNSIAYGLGSRKPNRISHKDGIIRFEQRKQTPFLFFVRGNIIIEVPRGSILEYDIESISGIINHDALSQGTLKLETVSGSIKIYQKGEIAFAESVSGSVRIYSAFEHVSAESVSGSVNIVANQDSKEILGESVSGSVRIQLEQVSGYEIDYSTLSGSVKDTYSNIAYLKSGQAENGDSSLKINVSTISGSIKLTDWE